MDSSSPLKCDACFQYKLQSSCHMVPSGPATVIAGGSLNRKRASRVTFVMENSTTYSMTSHALGKEKVLTMRLSNIKHHVGF